MPTYPLSYRVQDFLKRRVAWCERALAELEAFALAPEDSDFEIELARQRRREREARDLAHEYDGLAHEWAKAAPVSDEELEAIRQLSRHAEALGKLLDDAFAKAEAAAADKRESTRGALHDLRRGRRSVNTYRPGIIDSPGFIDRNV